MAVVTRFNQLSEDLGKAVHNFTSDATCSIKVALCNAANAPIATNSILADLTQIAYTNLSTRDMTGVTYEQVAGVATMTLDSLVLSASGGSAAPFRYVVLYNDDTPSKSLLFFADYGSDLTMTNGSSFNIVVQSLELFNLS